MRAFVTGNLVRDPELKFTNNGKAVCSVAVADNYRPNKEAEEEVTYVKLVIWGTLAENVANSMHKGQRVLAEGRLRERTWEGEHGTRREMELIVDSMGPDLRWQSVTVQKATTPRPAVSEEDPF